MNSDTKNFLGEAGIDLNTNSARRNFLKGHGVKVNDANLSKIVHTLTEIQAAIVEKVDQVCVEYLKAFCPKYAEVQADALAGFLKKDKIAFQAIRAGKEDEISNWNYLVYVMAQRTGDNPRTYRKVAFKVRHRALPVLQGKSKGGIKVEVEHEVIPFPEDVKLEETL